MPAVGRGNAFAADGRAHDRQAGGECLEYFQASAAARLQRHGEDVGGAEVRRDVRDMAGNVHVIVGARQREQFRGRALADDREPCAGNAATNGRQDLARQEVRRGRVRRPLERSHVQDRRRSGSLGGGHPVVRLAVDAVRHHDDSLRAKPREVARIVVRDREDGLREVCRALLHAREQRRFTAEILTADGVGRFVAGARREARVDVVHVHDDRHADGRAGIHERIQVVEVDGVRRSAPALLAQRLRDGAAPMPREQHVRLAHHRRSHDAARFGDGGLSRKRHQARLHAGGLERRAARIFVAARRADEAHVEVRCERAQQMIRAQVAARVERPRRLARHGEQGPARDRCSRSRHRSDPFCAVRGALVRAVAAADAAVGVTPPDAMAHPDRALRSAVMCVLSAISDLSASFAPRSPRPSQIMSSSRASGP